VQKIIETSLKTKADVEKDVKDARERLTEAQKELEEVNALLATTKEEASKLSSDLKEFLSISKRKSHLIKHLDENSYHDLILHPSRVVDVIGKMNNIEHTFHKTPCALYKLGFPHYNVILFLCMCQYHLWCTVMQNWILDVCASEECKKKFPV
jgi:hypothetical protein